MKSIQTNKTCENKNIKLIEHNIFLSSSREILKQTNEFLNQGAGHHLLQVRHFLGKIQNSSKDNLFNRNYSSLLLLLLLAKLWLDLFQQFYQTLHPRARACEPEGDQSNCCQLGQVHLKAS